MVIFVVLPLLRDYFHITPIGTGNECLIVIDIMGNKPNFFKQYFSNDFVVKQDFNMFSRNSPNNSFFIFVDVVPNTVSPLYLRTVFMKNASYSTHKNLLLHIWFSWNSRPHQTPVIFHYITQLYHSYRPSSNAGKWFNSL